MKKTLILEGPNGIGKNVFIDTVLKYCPYYKTHYAGSEVIKEVKDQLNLLPLVSYVTYETIYTSILNDSSKYPHIQYRSPLTSRIYNKIFRPDADWLNLDVYYNNKFFGNKYDNSFILWIMTYSEEYLKDQFKKKCDNLKIRIRDRKKELDNLVKINNLYFEYSNFFLQNGDKFSFNMFFDIGTGMLDGIEKLEMDIKTLIGKLEGENNPIYIIDMSNEYNVSKVKIFLNDKNLDENTKFVILSNKSFTCSNEELNKILFPMKTEYSNICHLKNNYPKIFFPDFFKTFCISHLKEKLNIFALD